MPDRVPSWYPANCRAHRVRLITATTMATAATAMTAAETPAAAAARRRAGPRGCSLRRARPGPAAAMAAAANPAAVTTPNQAWLTPFAPPTIRTVTTRPARYATG